MSIEQNNCFEQDCNLFSGEGVKEQLSAITGWQLSYNQSPSLENMQLSKAFTFFFVCNVLLSQYAFAQDERQQHDSIAAIIKNAINAAQPENIYRLTSSSFQAKMSAEQFATGMNKFRVKTGAWKISTYKNDDEKGYNYIAEFELASQLFSLRVNEQGKIDRMNFAAIPVAITPKNDRVSTNNPLADTIDKRVEQLVRPYIQKGNTAGLVIAIIYKGRVKRYSYGTINKAIRQLPDADTTIFEIGSVTKTFTSLLLAQQVIQGRMQLNDPINQYLPDSIPLLSYQGNPIRLVHLANHTATLPRLPANIFNGPVNPQDPYLHYIPDSLFSFLKHYQLTSKPGTTFSYSNYGAGLLGTILEIQLHMDFEKMIMERIARPLHMGHTFVNIPPDQRSRFVQGYNENGLATSPWDLASLKGSGAIRSTLNDMVKYTQAQLGAKNALSKAIHLSHNTTFEGPTQAMGLGWRINKTKQHTYYHHAGGTGGFRSFVGFDIKRQLGIVILSNAAEEVSAIGERLLQP